MPHLRIKTQDLERDAIELRPGTNRVGRDPDADFTLNHPSVSLRHCEFILSQSGLFVRDCDSTNGTCVNNVMVRATRLEVGNSIRLGDVELTVESTEIPISVPKLEPEKPAVNVMDRSGTPLCNRHPQVQASYRCSHCHEPLCTTCVHILRLQGGQPFYLCPLCGHKCDALGSTNPPKPKNFAGNPHNTVRMKIVSKPKN
jgi:pSer/pThr/pTyr-binding forkhead associated (FHA) protein